MEWIIGLVIVAALIGGGYLYIRERARRLSRQLFGTNSLVEGYQQQKQMLAETPKSVAGMTRIYLPQIARDFPEFNYEEFKVKGENMLRSAFSALTENNPDLLQSADQELKNTIALQVGENVRQKRREVYDQVAIHQTEIARYEKVGGTCTITLQSAVGHRHYVEENDQVILGDKLLKEQCKYNVQIAYIQDVSKISEGQTAFEATVCPNCGGALDSLGDKFCPYCGSQVQSINIRTWAIHDYEKQ